MEELNRWGRGGMGRVCLFGASDKNYKKNWKEIASSVPCLSVCLPAWLSVCLSSICHLCLPAYLSVCQSSTHHVCLSVCFWDRVSQRSPGWPRTHRYLLAPTHQVLGLKPCTTMPHTFSFVERAGSTTILKKTDFQVRIWFVFWILNSVETSCLISLMAVSLSVTGWYRIVKII